MFFPLPHTLLFASTLVTSTLAVISSSSFLTMWAALELNLLSLIPLMLMSPNKLEAEAAVKYFLAQALGSSLFLIAYIMTSYHPEFMILNQSPHLLLTLALLVKLGAAPAHFWFPSVMASSSWMTCLLLSTWQKIAPLLMLSMLFSPSTSLLFLAAASSALVGGISGLNQTQMNALLAYSSIGHLGWMISMSQPSMYLMALYFMVYALTTTLIMSTFFLLNLFSIKQLSPLIYPTRKLLFTISILMLSLGGLPPMLGFAPKMLTLNLLSTLNHTPLAILLIIGSTLNLSYYMVIVFNLYITTSSPSTTHQPHHMSLTPVIALTTPIFIIPYLL